MDNNNHTLRIDTPPDIAQGVNGEPGYVVFKTRFKNKYRTAFTRAIELTSEVVKLKPELMSEAEQAGALTLVEEFNHSLGDVYRAYAHIVLDWNWLDDETGEALPKPNDNPDVFSSELYDEQVAWIREHITHLNKYRVTEGNAPGGNGSLPG